MEIKELGHVVISVKDLGDSVRFYRDVLGFKEVARLGERGVMFSGGRTHHELLVVQGDNDAVPPTAKTLGLRHFALKIGTTDEELHTALDELAEAGVQVDHTTDHGGVTHSAYLRDPDGNRVELYIDVQPETWRTDPAGVAGRSQALTV